MTFFFIAFAIFSGAFLAAGYWLWAVPQSRDNDVLLVRMRELRARGGSAMRQRAASDLIRSEVKGPFDFLAEFFNWLGLLRRLNERIVQANLPYKATNVVVLSIGLFAITFLLCGLFGLKILGLKVVFGGLIGFLPVAFIMRKRAARLARFEQMLPDAIDLFNRSMKAGHNLQSGLETIASETLDPVKMEFRKVIEEMALGSQTETALHGLGARVPLIDLKFFVIGLILQRQTGANMIAMLENLALLIRERLNLAAKLKAGTAQQRLSAALLCAMPGVLLLIFWLFKPEVINFLFEDPTGNNILTYAIVSEIIAILIIRKLAKPKF